MGLSSCSMRVPQLTDTNWSREAVRDSHLRGITDIQRLGRKLASHKITLQELCQLYMASMQLPALVDALTNHQGTPHLLPPPTTHESPAGVARCRAPLRCGYERCSAAVLVALFVQITCWVLCTAAATAARV